jgi:hypothetical protein
MSVELTFQHGGAQSHIGANAFFELPLLEASAGRADDERANERGDRNDQRVSQGSSRAFIESHEATARKRWVSGAGRIIAQGMPRACVNPHKSGLARSNKLFKYNNLNARKA